jgi:hypothetical protein
MKKIYFFSCQRFYSHKKKTTTVAPKQQGKYDTSKFNGNVRLLATPNMFSQLAAGLLYYQQP